MRTRALAVLFAVTTGVVVATTNAPAADPPATACTTPKTYCDGADGYYVSYEDKEKIVAAIDPILKELRTCLDSVGANKLAPSVLIRFDENGKAATSTVEAPGYENQLCVARIVAKLSSLTNPRETKVRCAYDCPKTAPTPPPPVPVPPPTASASTSASAQPLPPPPPVEKKPGYHEEKVWYGYQTLIADAVSLVLITGGIAANQGGLGYPGLAMFYLGTPIVHMVHGNIGPGFGSLAMRVLIPPTTLGIGVIFGAIVGTSGQSADKDPQGFGSGLSRGVLYGGLAGLFIGVAICVGIDAGVFGYEKVKVDDGQHAYLRSRQKPWYTVTPIIDIEKDRAAMGFGGTF